MNNFSEYEAWRENFLGAFRQISDESDYEKLAKLYPNGNYTKNNCKQRKNNLLRNGNRNIYLDDLYAVSRFSNKTPNNLLLGYNNISFFWSELAGENLFSSECIEKIVEAIESDKSYRSIYVPKEIEDFLYYAKAVIYEVNDKKIRKPIFNINDNSLDFMTTGKATYSYTPNLFYGRDASDALNVFLENVDEEFFSECEASEKDAFIELVEAYLDAGKCEADKNDSDIHFRIKNWVCNCTMWLLLSYIADTCERTSESIEEYFENHNEVMLFMLKIFVFGTKVTKQKRVTDEVTKEKKRIRYSAFLGCNNEQLESITDDYDYYYEAEYETASISDMKKSELSDLLNFELR